MSSCRVRYLPCCVKERLSARNCSAPQTQDEILGAEHQTRYFGLHGKYLSQVVEPKRSFDDWEDFKTIRLGRQDLSDLIELLGYLDLRQDDTVDAGRYRLLRIDVVS